MLKIYVQVDNICTGMYREKAKWREKEGGGVC